MPFDQDIYVHTALFQQGKEKGFNHFYHLLYPALLYYAFRIINDKPAAEDIVEEAFIKIWERHSGFSHPQVIKTWLYTTVRNACINTLKEREIKERHADNIAYENQDAHEPGHLNNMIIAEVVADVHAVLEVLPRECRRIFKMLYVGGKSTRQVADELKLSISTVKNQKARGIHILKNRFPRLASALEAFSLILLILLIIMGFPVPLG